MMNRLVSLLCVLLLGGFLAGCGGADSSDSGSAADLAGSGSGNEAADSAAKNAVQPADVAKAAAAPAASTVTRLVRTAEITVEVKSVSAAARTVRTAAVTLGGIVSNESTKLPVSTENDTGEQQSAITLRVPEPKMDEALTRISGVGRELDRSTTSDDVTATIVDLDSRVATQTKSVARVRDLLDRASSLQDVVLLESELARRESDLESIQARQRALVDKAALATITVTLHSPGVAVDEPEEAGFLTGLDGGWTALKASTTVVLTVLGALLPVSVVIVVLGIPAYLVRRRLKPQTPEQIPPPAAPQAPVPTPAPVP